MRSHGRWVITLNLRLEIGLGELLAPPLGDGYPLRSPRHHSGAVLGTRGGKRSRRGHGSGAHAFPPSPRGGAGRRAPGGPDNRRVARSRRGGVADGVQAGAIAAGQCPLVAARRHRLVLHHPGRKWPFPTGADCAP